MHKNLTFICIACLFLLAACQVDDIYSNSDKQDSKNTNLTEKKSNITKKHSINAKIDLTNYATLTGYIMEDVPREVATTFTLEGTIMETDKLLENRMWVTVQKQEAIEEDVPKEMEYFIPIENGNFQRDINLHHGAGTYQVTVRLPAMDKEDYYNDVAEFTLKNTDETIVRDIELTQIGIENNLQFAETVSGWNKASEHFEIAGSFDSDEHTSVMFEIIKDNERKQLNMPIKDGSFKGDIPLYFGEGTHEILVHLPERERYYHSATLYVHNDKAKAFPNITQYTPFIDYGLQLENPSFAIAKELEDVEYYVEGKINEDAPYAHAVSHVIVGIEHEENPSDTATYYFPVVNNEFSGTAHFRFGPGDYKVTIFVPIEQTESHTFRFTSAMEFEHTVTGIEDKRDILPSRGIESDSPRIFEQAKELTQGLTTERDKAKAIYEFVAKHVAYDVEKYHQDIFHPDDSALQTLEKGSGVCQDYTFLAIALLRSIDIEARYVQGHAGGRHAWVEAKVDGEWIEMDPTWGAGYVMDDVFHFHYREDYFDPDPDFLAETHTREGLLY